MNDTVAMNKKEESGKCMKESKANADADVNLQWQSVIYTDMIRQKLSLHSQNEGMKREKNPDTVCYDRCKGTGIRKDVLTTPFSLCWIQYIEFENNKKQKKSEPNKNQEI